MDRLRSFSRLADGYAARRFRNNIARMQMLQAQREKEADATDRSNVERIWRGRIQSGVDRVRPAGPTLTGDALPELEVERPLNEQEYAQDVLGTFSRLPQTRHGEAARKRLSDEVNLRGKLLPEQKQRPLRFDNYTDPSNMQYRVGYDENTGAEVTRVPVGKVPVNSSTAGALNERDQRLADLENRKRGMERKLAARGINLDELVSGEKGVPNQPKDWRQVDVADPSNPKGTIKQWQSFGEEPDREISEYLDTVAQLESEMKQQGKAFTPARDLPGKAKKAQKKKKYELID